MDELTCKYVSHVQFNEQKQIMSKAVLKKSRILNNWVGMHIFLGFSLFVIIVKTEIVK